MVEWTEPDDEPYEDDDHSFIVDTRPKSSILRVCTCIDIEMCCDLAESVRSR